MLPIAWPGITQPCCYCCLAITQPHSCHPAIAQPYYPSPGIAQLHSHHLAITWPHFHCSPSAQALPHCTATPTATQQLHHCPCCQAAPVCLPLTPWYCCTSNPAAHATASMLHHCITLLLAVLQVHHSPCCTTLLQLSYIPIKLGCVLLPHLPCTAVPVATQMLNPDPGPTTAQQLLLCSCHARTPLSYHHSHSSPPSYKGSLLHQCYPTAPLHGAHHCTATESNYENHITRTSLLNQQNSPGSISMV